mmetsp:Transcript_7101/g.8194  ORF Transcript_7101/g.8194 Transcript_7101/m.8194 type:complete len:355 (+) Transcript_7101:310-1374(+)|eukprot:CAMPEP_0197862278 /NCGR_PEP_ID=MMETSP1438-20131217/38931_1 /TAXON_ID=1461541 /ORGANISM="Pterosperma sp., Strain CCMP1384" /LENGTH=354 /DNA_ID=CAMNT_0043479795 /DNA_START=308 /DNA_END=1372 /DNA_ORIENTATION=+
MTSQHRFQGVPVLRHAVLLLLLVVLCFIQPANSTFIHFQGAGRDGGESDVSSSDGTSRFWSRKLLEIYLPSLFSSSGVTAPMKKKASFVELLMGWKTDPTSNREVTLDEDMHSGVDWLDRSCEKIIFDLGANLGDTIERWYGNGDFQGRAGHVKPKKGARKPPPPNPNMTPEERKKFCMLSFEANPNFTNRLRRVEKQHQEAGYSVSVLTETAVSSEDGTISFHLDEASETGYGSSIYGDKVVNVVQKDAKGKVQKHKATLGKKVTVRSLNFAKILEEIPQEPKPYIVVKMDIEGAEYKVLPALLTSGQICKIDYLIIEWHSHKLGSYLPENVDANLEWLLSEPPCSVEISHDD